MREVLFLIYDDLINGRGQLPEKTKQRLCEAIVALTPDAPIEIEGKQNEVIITKHTEIVSGSRNCDHRDGSGSGVWDFSTITEALDPATREGLRGAFERFDLENPRYCIEDNPGPTCSNQDLDRPQEPEKGWEKPEGPQQAVPLSDAERRAYEASLPKPVRTID